jgi:hypothetical protein
MLFFFVIQRHSRLVCGQFTTSHSYTLVWVFGIIDVYLQSANNSRKSSTLCGKECRIVTSYVGMLIRSEFCCVSAESPDFLHKTKSTKQSPS